MRILLDTNILIVREDDRIISKEIQQLFKILNEIRAEVIIHPASIKDVERDKNEQRRKVMLSKIEAYSVMDRPPNPMKDEGFMSAVKWSDGDKDQVDNTILHAVYKNAVDFLLTEDKGIHRKARKLDIDESVLLVDDALRLFDRYAHAGKVISPPALQREYVYNLDINDPIFGSLKKDYRKKKDYGKKTFEEWFEDISKEGRECWIHYTEGGSIGAVLIHKTENEPVEGIPPLPKSRRLKLCTMKVSYVGKKIGELLIKLSVDLCVKNNIREMYLTHYTEYGFKMVSRKEDGEGIFLKKLTKDDGRLGSMSPFEASKMFYPTFYDGAKVKKVIIPIQPQFHDLLFTDYGGRQSRLHEHQREFIVEGNTIKKAYLCHAPAKKLQPGVIVIFYRSRDHKRVTSVGVIESVRTGITNVEHILHVVGKRTVYSHKDIERIAKKPATIILFRHHFNLKKPLTEAELKASGVLKRAPQSVTEISHEGYEYIKQRGGIDERYTVH